jgi:uncharacterized protein involved in exopolysaccharide biosynthesis
MANNDYEEINLLDYVKIIIKRWKIIVIIPLITIIIAAGYTVFMVPKVYEANGLIEIGQISGNLVEPIAQSTTLILTETTAKQILEQVQPKELKEHFPITKAQIQGFLKKIDVNKSKTKKLKEAAMPENFLHLSYQDINPKVAQKVIEILQNLILEEHQKQYDLKIKARDQFLIQKEKELIAAKEQLSQAEKKIAELSNLRYPSSYAEAQGRALSSWIASRDGLSSKIASLEAVILNQKLSQDYDKMSQVISAPFLPDTPTKYQRLSVTLAIAAILGGFIGILGAFGLEWWETNSSKLKVQN